MATRTLALPLVREAEQRLRFTGCYRELQAMTAYYAEISSGRNYGKPTVRIFSRLFSLILAYSRKKGGKILAEGVRIAANGSILKTFVLPSFNRTVAMTKIFILFSWRSGLSFPQSMFLAFKNHKIAKLTQPMSDLQRNPQVATTSPVENELKNSSPTASRKCQWTAGKIGVVDRGAGLRRRLPDETFGL